jgi:fructosamine-3-kinase
LQHTGVLVLQHLALGERGDESALGRQLAELHQHTAEHYGLSVNNFIGTRPQLNGQHTCWADFWWQCRLAPQVQMAQGAGHFLGATAAQLQALSNARLQAHNPPASLLHGDLWAGNKAYLTDGRPALFDPACYYGDRETDLAFTLVFGGFGHDFYQRYQQAWPLPKGWQAREPLYNLYHLLNHLNMFGRGYLSSVQSAVKSLQDRGASVL